MATEMPYRAERGAPPTPPGEGPTEVKTKRVTKKEDAAKSTPKTESRSSSNVFRAEMLERFGGKMKEPPMPDEGAPLAKGGSASSRADGICKRGKTRGKMY